MRVLFVSPAALDQRVDGLTVFSHSLALNLLAGGVENCSIFTSDLSHHPREGKITRLEVEGLAVYRAALPVPRNPAEALNAPGCDILFRRTVDDLHPDIIHFHSFELLSANLIAVSREMGIPAVMTLHDFYLICAAVRLMEIGEADICPGPDMGRRCGSCLAATGHLVGRYRGTLRWLKRRWDVKVFRRWQRAYGERFERLRSLVKGVSAVTSPSELAGNLMVKEGMLTHYELIPNGSDLTSVPPRHDAGDLVLGILARHSRTKGTHLAVRAVREMAELRIVLEIRGDGDHTYLKQLRTLAGEDRRIIFEGPYAQHRVSDVMSGIDALLLPSIWPENSPLVVQDALAAGRPAIVPSGSGAAEAVVDGRHGLHFERGNVFSLAAAIRRLVEDKGLIDRLRENIKADRPIVARSEVAKRYFDLYQKVIAGS